MVCGSVRVSSSVIWNSDHGYHTRRLLRPERTNARNHSHISTHPWPLSSSRLPWCLDLMAPSIDKKPPLWITSVCHTNAHASLHTTWLGLVLHYTVRVWGQFFRTLYVAGANASLPCTCLRPLLQYTVRGRDQCFIMLYVFEASASLLCTCLRPVLHYTVRVGGQHFLALYVAKVKVKNTVRGRG